MAALAQRGGVMAPEDLAAHRSHPTRPIHSTFRGHTVYEIPPPVAVRAVPRPPRSAQRRVHEAHLHLCSADI